MNKKLFLVLPLAVCCLSGCLKNSDGPFVFHVEENSSLKVINFADTQFDNIDDLEKNPTLYKTIKYAINEEHPDLITFSGDNCWKKKTKSCYRKLCRWMDKFKIPYFMVFGNHDREHAKAAELINIVNRSKYGLISRGPYFEGTQGNYCIDIKNENEEIVHSIFMMDSRDYYDHSEEDYQYVTNPIPGMKYHTHNDKYYYGSGIYDGIRDGQIDWYVEQVNRVNAQSTIITHMPIMEYAFAYEDYLIALKNEDQALLNEIAPIGHCDIKEKVACDIVNHGLFNKMVELGSTKNFICGHDHSNDFSLVYKGVRLTFALKTGNECYWSGETMNGYTSLEIKSDGSTILKQNYYNPLA